MADMSPADKRPDRTARTRQRSAVPGIANAIITWGAYLTVLQPPSDRDPTWCRTACAFSWPSETPKESHASVSCRCNMCGSEQYHMRLTSRLMRQASKGRRPSCTCYRFQFWQGSSEGQKFNLCAIRREHQKKQFPVRSVWVHLNGINLRGAFAATPVCFTLF